MRRPDVGQAVSPAQRVALTIAGSDPSGGAGIQADLKTFHQFGVYGEAVITLITVQNTTRCDVAEYLTPELILAQLEAVLEDIPPAAAKTGAIGRAAQALARAAADFTFPLVVDPVMVSKHGASLGCSPSELIHRAFLVTPNLPEAAALTGMEIHDIGDMRRAAARLRDMGASAVLVKGGHLDHSAPATDVLLADGIIREFTAPRIDTPHTHGTGCTYSAAIVAQLALGAPLDTAVERAKAYITEAIRSNPGLGHGSGPINHHGGLKS